MLKWSGNSILSFAAIEVTNQSFEIDELYMDRDGEEGSILELVVLCEDTIYIMHADKSIQ